MTDPRHRHPFLTVPFHLDTTDAQGLEVASIRLRSHVAAMGWEVSGPLDYRISRTRNGLWVTVQALAVEVVPESPDTLDAPPLPAGDLPWDPAAEAERFLAAAARDDDTGR